MDLQAKFPSAYIYLESSLGYRKCNRVNSQAAIPVLLSLI